LGARPSFRGGGLRGSPGGVHGPRLALGGGQPRTPPDRPPMAPGGVGKGGVGFSPRRRPPRRPAHVPGVVRGVPTPEGHVPRAPGEAGERTLGGPAGGPPSGGGSGGLRGGFTALTWRSGRPTANLPRSALYGPRRGRKGGGRIFTSPPPPPRRPLSS